MYLSGQWFWHINTGPSPASASMKWKEWNTQCTWMNLMSPHTIHLNIHLHILCPHQHPHALSHPHSQGDMCLGGIRTVFVHVQCPFYFICQCFGDRPNKVSPNACFNFCVWFTWPVDTVDACTALIRSDWWCLVDGSSVVHLKWQREQMTTCDQITCNHLRTRNGHHHNHTIGYIARVLGAIYAGDVTVVPRASRLHQ